MIKRSFKYIYIYICCDVSNSLDRTEDNLIFNFNRVEKVNNQGREIEEDVSNNESGSEDDNEVNENESEGEDSESEDNYYEENEARNVIHNWN